MKVLEEDIRQLYQQTAIDADVVIVEGMVRPSGQLCRAHQSGTWRAAWTRCVSGSTAPDDQKHGPAWPTVSRFKRQGFGGPGIPRSWAHRQQGAPIWDMARRPGSPTVTH